MRFDFKNDRPPTARSHPRFRSGRRDSLPGHRIHSRRYIDCPFRIRQGKLRQTASPKLGPRLRPKGPSQTLGRPDLWSPRRRLGDYSTGRSFHFVRIPHVLRNFRPISLDLQPEPRQFGAWLSRKSRSRSLYPSGGRGLQRRSIKDRRSHSATPPIPLRSCLLRADRE